MKWEKEHQVKERKIKQQPIGPAEDAESTPIIVGNDIVRHVVLEEHQSCVNQLGETVIIHLTGKNRFIAIKKKHLCSLINFI